jgi:hypothetical protein
MSLQFGKRRCTTPEIHMQGVSWALAVIVTMPLSLSDAKLAAKAARQWDKYVQACQGLSGVVRERTTMEDGTLAVTAESEWRENSNCWLARRHRHVHVALPGQPTGYTEDVYCFNPQYAFILVRTQHDQKFKVRDVSWRAQLSSTLKMLDDERRATAVRLPSILRLADNPNHTLPDIFASKGFRIMSSAALPASPSILVITCEYQDRTYGRTYCTLHLDQERYWLPVVYSVSNTSFHIEGRNVVTDRNGAIPLCTEMTWTGEYRDDKRGIRERGTKTVTLEQSIPVRLPPDSDFTLSAFGLPEPFGIEWEKPTPWWLYIGGGTLGLIALAALGYRLFGRRAA